MFSQTSPVHQISIDGDALMPLFFSSAEGNQKISYRKKTKSDKYLRAGLLNMKRKVKKQFQYLRVLTIY